MAAIFEPLFTKLSTSLNIWASGSVKADTETFCEIH